MLMLKMFLKSFTGIAACLVLFSAQTTAQSSVPIALSAAYSKGGSSYDIVVKDTPGAKLVLYVNDKSPNHTTVNKKDWATFHRVKLVDSNKLSFTQQFKGKNGKLHQVPLKYVRYAHIANGRVSFTISQETETAPASPTTTTVQTPAPDPSPAPASTPGCTNGSYINSAGNTVCSPETSNSGAPAGATAQCRDGTYSFSQSRSGTCSHHGGVSTWL